MFDLFARALRHPIDYAGALRTTDLQLLEKRQESERAYSFIFTAAELPSWRAGQHAIFTLPDKPVTGKTWRAFSIASAPYEEVIRIGTIIPPEASSFKAALRSLQPGERIRMHGPFGELHLRPDMKTIIAVAGGIGITPMRAIMSELKHQESMLRFQLIYSATEYVYKNELERWRNDLLHAKIAYTTTPEEVQTALTERVDRFGNNAHYLLSGPPGMIAALRRELRSRRITPSRILNDPFKGY